MGENDVGEKIGLVFLVGFAVVLVGLLIVYFVFSIPAALTVAAVLTLVRIPVGVGVIIYFTYRTHLRIKEKASMNSRWDVLEGFSIGYLQT